MYSWWNPEHVCVLVNRKAHKGAPEITPRYSPLVSLALFIVEYYEVPVTAGASQNPISLRQLAAGRVAPAPQGVRENEVLTPASRSALPAAALSATTQDQIPKIPQVAQKTTLRTRESAAYAPPGQRSQFSWNIRSLAPQVQFVQLYNVRLMWVLIQLRELPVHFLLIVRVDGKVKYKFLHSTLLLRIKEKTN